MYNGKFRFDNGIFVEMLSIQINLPLKINYLNLNSHLHSKNLAILNRFHNVFDTCLESYAVPALAVEAAAIVCGLPEAANIG